jgi:transglutaminase-like putative cysteine protease
MPQSSTPRDSHLSALDRYFEISLYLLLLTSVLALVSTGKLDLFTMLAAPATLLVKGIRWLRRLPAELSSRAATAIVAGYLVFFPIDLWWVSRSIASAAQNPGLMAALLAAIHMMLFVMIVRLYSARTTRDHLFLAMLAFAAMLCAAILTVGTAYLAFFFAFLLLAISTFIGLEMRRSAEAATAAPLESGTGAARRLQRALGGASAALAFGTLVVGTAIFFMIPRVSAGYLSGYNLQPTLISGFTDDVELGEIGVIKRSSAIVMHIQVQGDHVAAQNVHWRGVVLTNFDGRRWSTDERAPEPVLSGSDGWYPLAPGPAPALLRAAPLRYSVLLEPLATTSLFFAAEPQTARGTFGGAGSIGSARRSYLVRDRTGSVFDPFYVSERLRYDAVSMQPENPPGDLRSASTTYPSDIRATYLQLPALDPRIPALAQQITAHSATPYDKASAIEAYLRTHYGYTLDLTGTPPADPLAYFLFTRRAGHCEYFASAMTVMVRSLGIPARYINGFLPGEYNDVDGEYVIRASDAHSWVEVYFPDYGWITFDPTPPSADEAMGFAAHLAQYWDWFQVSWSEWVINYDFSHQFQLAQGVQRASREWTEHWIAHAASIRLGATNWMLAWQIRLLRWPHRDSLWLVLIAAFTALLAWRIGPPLWKFWQLHAGVRGSATAHLATLYYSQMLRVLERRGMKKSDAQTPSEFAASLGLGEIAAPVSELTTLYQAARFGGATADRRQLKELLERIQSTRRPRPAHIPTLIL